MNNRNLGAIGESIATKFLEDKGYKILDKNYRALGTEIDIVALDGDILVFIEVKSRSSKKFGNAFEAVNGFKIQNIIRTSMSYIVSKQLDSFQVRYDVVEYYINENYINHIENAFEVV
ncbi:YraN family protein [Peptoniphilus sp. oral taxon 386]|uniref:YraN family protein n=1 Tax=Peptoniphilus sp. oral taxon 386 TaxID=652713 RepID=UPI0002E8E5FF|nr:YraN family protein [Peptoniphilus sp. oral taxon 386]